MTVPGNLSSPLLATAAEAAAAAGVATRSLRFNSGDSPYLNRTPSSAGNRKTFTFSAWVKRSSLTAGSPNGPVIFSADTGNAPWTAFQFETSDGTLQITTFAGSSLGLKTNAQFRDPSAWYHLVIAFDTTQSTASDRVKCYVNGVAQTFSNTNYPAQNSDTKVNGTFPQYIGFTNNQHFDGYLADIYLIDGSQLDPTSFGAFDDNGVWQSAAYSGTYGTNGFHLLDFANESTVGHDSSGNNNDFTANNISTTAGAGNDVLFDVPTNGSQSDSGAGGEVSGCYATLNPLHAITNNPTNGNLDIGGSSTSTYTKAVSTIYIDPEDTTGYYCEFTVADKGTNPAGHIQLLPPSVNLSSSGAGMTGGVGLVMRGGGGGNKWWSLTGQSANSDTGVAHADNQVIGVAVKNGKLYMAINNTWVLSGNPATESNPLYSSLSGLKGFLVGTTDGDWQCNWGQRAFSYSAPTGYRPVSSASLPTPTIADGSEYFDVALYTGTGAAKTISGLNLSPDIAWIKERNDTNWHRIIDAVRGQKEVFPNATNAESSFSQGLNSFNSDGFTLGTGSDSNVNTSGNTYVSWLWDAGSSTATNTSGSITSQVRANPTAGFSILTFTNTTSNSTVGHGLNAKPDMIIWKKRNGTSHWGVYHSSLGATKVIYLNLTNAAATGSEFWNNTEPTSSVITTKGEPDSFGSAGDTVMYVFTAVSGYSAISSYTSTGSNNFIYTGFRVAFLMVKKVTSSADSSYEGWFMVDSTRGNANIVNESLFANSAQVEGKRGNGGTPTDSNFGVDLLSNGFCFKNNATEYNRSDSSTYIYYAVAENPFQANGGLAR